MRVAVVGAGWAGIAAAVHARLQGHQVSVFEMAGHLGGRARTVQMPHDVPADNGQHILIGAYTETLRLMRLLGVDVERVLHRRPLCLVDARGQGLQLGGGDPQWAFVRAIWQHADWTWRERLALTTQAMLWAAKGFRCKPGLSVAALTAAIPKRLRDEFIDPLCIAALNTLSHEACASTFLRVLHDALKSGPGSADLLLPGCRLSDLLPEPAHRWFERQGVAVHTRERVLELRRELRGVTNQWLLISGSGQEPFDQVVLSCTSSEASRLARPINARWAQQASALHYEPITTVTLYCPGTRLPQPMLTLPSDQVHHPAQFVFDQGLLGLRAGELTFVISAAQAWVDQGTEAITRATISQAQLALQSCLNGPIEHVRTLTEKRATFRCTPGLVRPEPSIAPGLWAAADYIKGPYPATLEGAIRCATSVVHSWPSHR